MRRYPIYFTLVIAILLVLLAGSWTWFLVFGEGEAGADALPRVVPSPAEVEPTADRAALDDGSRVDEAAYEPITDPGTRDSDRSGDAIDPADTPHRRAEPPDAVEARKTVESGKAEEKAEEEDEIVVERKALDPGVVDSNGDDEDLDAFVVSTLQEPAKRRRVTQWHGGQFEFRNGELGVISRRKLRGVSMPIPPPKVTHILRGKVVYPELNKQRQQELVERHRHQVTMYTPELPLMRAVIGKKREFILPMTDAMVRNYTRKGQRVYVHSPAFRLKSGKDYVEFRKDRTDFEIELELTLPLQVIVNVTPEKALREDIRVWLERRGDPRSGDLDDSLYMRARVPSSGRLHFFVPARYGKLRVAATGKNWHSGHPQAWDCERVRGDKLHVKVTLVERPCDLITGQVVSDESQALEGVRLACTHYGVVTYTDGRGQFTAHVPFEDVPVHRQFIVTQPFRRPEVLPLETRAVATPGVTGNKPNGPFEVTLAGKAKVELRLPYSVNGDEVVMGGGRLVRWDDPGGSSRNQSVELVWGTQMLFVQNNRLQPEPTLFIEEEAWTKVFQQYAEGVETPVVRVKRLADELK